jgi:glycosyltransferase involved in cell wall biosynthesis
MKRLLFLLPSVPDPPDSGARMRNLALLRLAGQHCEVDALAFGIADEQQRLAALARRALVVPLPGRSTVERARQLAQRAPDIVRRFESTDMERALRCMLKSGGYDAVQAEGIEMAAYLRYVPPEMRIYDAHNAEFLLQRRASETGDSLIGRLYSRLQWRRLERFEGAVVRGSRLTLAVSEHDANQLLALSVGEGRVHVVPNAIQVAGYAFRQPADDDAPNLLFVGKLDYRPNADAVRWLLQHVLPGLFEAIPAVRLFIVGANPPGWLVKAGQVDPRIAVTGYVVDERPYLERCSVLALPVQMAGGSRLKALVAMASGLPIVSTRLGMEGIEAEPGQHFLLADEPTQWVATLEQLLHDSDRRRELATRAHELVKERYDWSSIGPKLNAAYAALTP